MRIKNLVITAVLSLGLASAASAASFTYNFTTSSGDVTTASPVSPTAGSPTVTATAWSTTNGSSWTQELVTQNGSYGMGVRSYSNDSHTVDNGVRSDFLLFTFSQPVDVNSFRIGYIDGDSDYRWAVGSPALPVNGNVLSTLYSGGTNVTNGTINPANFINASNVFGTYLLLGTRPELDNQGNPAGNDRIKISQVSIDTGNVPDAGSTVALLGLALAGLASLKRRFAV